MATSVVYDLIDRLVTQLTTALPSTKVIDGDTVSGDFGDYLMIGWDDPDNDRATAAESRQSWAGLGNRARDEEGTVTCLAISWNGAGNIKTARDGVESITSAVETSLRADPNLAGSITGLQWVGYGLRNEWKQWLAETGAVAMCTFEIEFKARL